MTTENNDHIDPYDKLSDMDKVQLRMLNTNISEHLTALMSGGKKATLESVRNAIDENTKHFPTAEKPKVEVHNQTWVELYGSNSKAFLAWSANKLISVGILKRRYTKANIATLLFPYTEELHIERWLDQEKYNAREFIIEGGSLTANDLVEHILDTGSLPVHDFLLKSPEGVVVAELQIKPIKAVDYITIDVKISNDL